MWFLPVILCSIYVWVLRAIAMRLEGFEWTETLGTAAFGLATRIVFWAALARLVLMIDVAMGRYMWYFAHIFCLLIMPITNAFVDPVGIENVFWVAENTHDT